MAKTLKNYENRVIILEGDRFYIYSIINMEGAYSDTQYVGVYYDYNPNRIVLMSDTGDSLFSVKETKEPTKEERTEALNRFFYTIFNKATNRDDPEMLVINSLMNNWEM